jgi:apolipoprotein N-acyltransferase
MFSFSLQPSAFIPLLTSLLLILSYPKFNQGWLAWFALVPLTVSLWRAQTLKQALSAGLAAGFLFYAGILYWIYPTMRAGGVNAFVSVLGLVSLSLVMSVEFFLIAAFGFYFKKIGPLAWPYGFALGWALLEYGKNLLSLKAVWFPWFMLGYTQWAYTPLIQVVSLTGVYGLSSAVCFTGALAGTLLVSGEKPWNKVLRFAPAVLVFASLWGYGRHELKAACAIRPAGYINTALLQPSINLYDKWDEEKAGENRRGMEALLNGLRGAELIVWPENALPGWIEDPFYADWLRSLSKKTGSYAIVGSVSRGDGRHVGAFLLDRAGDIKTFYAKRRLVPFGEYVPMRRFLGKFINPVASLGEFSEGPLEQDLFELKGGVKLAPVICYESIFPGLFASDAGAGASVFVNITNDGWYLDTAAPYQHFLVNIFRAVETRRPVIRAANNGISAAIDPWGRVLAEKGLGERGVLRAMVPVYADSGLTFYVSHGRWFILACFLACAALMLAGRIIRKQDAVDGKQ